jgi:hypothetical protein
LPLIPSYPLKDSYISQTEQRVFMKKFYLLILVGLCFASGSSAQTLIDPNTGGGFDVGNTFAANGWTVVNSSKNKWVVGTTTYKSAPNSAYISKDSIASPGLYDFDYDYDNTTTHISHFYQQVTIPANVSSATLSFFLKGNVELDGSNNVVDGPEVYADLGLVAPVADALPGGTAIQIFPTFTLNPNPLYVSETLNLTSLAGQTILLIFTWVNDNDGVGSDPPASIDAITVKYCIKNKNYALTGDGYFCEGSSGATIGLVNSVTGITYQLSYGGNPVGTPVMGSTGSPITFDPQTTEGVYAVVWSTGECSGTLPGSVTVTKVPLPTPSAGSNSPLCPGSTLNLTAGGGSGGSTYGWSGPNGFISSTQNPSINNISAVEVGTYTVRLTDIHGCWADATTGVALTAGATGGTIVSVATCSGGSGTLTLSGNSVAPTRWEYATDSTNGPWTSLSNTTNSQNFSGITVPTFYRAVVPGCSNVYSSIATVEIHNYWTGADGTNPTDWNTPGNWSDNTVPSLICDDVYIPNTVNKPILSNTPVATIKNLHIFAGASVTITSPGLMQIQGYVSNLGVFDVTGGTLELNGTSGVQNIDGGLFKNNTVKNLIISNTVTVANTAMDTLNITGTLSFGNSSGVLNTGNNLTLKSSASATANVGILAAGNAINGDVIVERYIATGTSGAPNHGKSWQLLAVPTSGPNYNDGQSIKASWQEGATLTNVSSSTAGTAGNPIAGYGTMVTGDVAGATAQPTPGFDAYTPSSPSVKYYDSASKNYFGPVSTQAPVYNKQGCFVFVRGDRSVYTSAGAATPTILRTKGTLFTPAHPAPLSTVAAGDFQSVGNPYASAIDMRKITLGGGAQQFFSLWDPRLGGSYNYGAFQYFSFDGTNYTVTPGGGSFGLPGSINNYIQSGQAFFVQAFGSNGTVGFTESCKTNGSSLFTTPAPVNQVVHSLRTSLNSVNADGSTGYLLDGVLNMFDPAWSNRVDGLDARKSANTGENLGIKSAGKLLSIERRQPVTREDTIFLSITGERNQPYRFHFDAENLDPSVQGYLVDSYANTRIPLNITGTTDVDFTVASVSGSNAANRFMIVFEPLKALPVTFTSIKAWKQDKNIDIKWRVDNEVNMKQYKVEKSTDGIQFTGIATKAPVANNGGSAAYVIADTNPAEGFNYYRIKGLDAYGKTSYSNVVNVFMGSLNRDITIYPNPITDGMIHLQLMNEPPGKYKIRLLNKLGQVILQKEVTHAGGNGTELIRWDYNLAHGMYQLEVTRPDGTGKDINVLY